jgi:hypothetical protein
MHTKRLETSRFWKSCTCSGSIGRNRRAPSCAGQFEVKPDASVDNAVAERNLNVQTEAEMIRIKQIIERAAAHRAATGASAWPEVRHR